MLKRFSSKQSNNILTVFLILLTGLFSFSLFKNIQYPLLWNDEAITVLFTTRVQKFGYPKLDDGKNLIPQTLSIFNNKNTDNDYDLDNDWLMYYFTLPFLLLSQKFNNLYTITAILRLPFALIGIAGLIIFARTITQIIPTRRLKNVFLLLFVFFELISVSLPLHLREARYYSLLVFLVACILSVFINYHYYQRITYKRYFVSLVFFTLLVLFTYRPAFFAFTSLYLIHALSRFRFNLPKIKIISSLRKSKELVKLLTPILVILFLSIPYFIVFKVFYYISEVSKLINFNYLIYLKHIINILNFFWRFDMLSFAFVLKILTIGFWFYSVLQTKNKNTFQKVQLSSLLSLFFLIYIFTIARIPYFMFTRYYIILQPILTIIIVLDIFIIRDFIYLAPSNKKKSRIFFLKSIIVIFIIFHISNNKNYLLGHFYELTHQYRGPLDYVMPYIKDNFKNPKALVIATNYEEYSYMFYLDSKVTIGYTGNNLEKDLKIQPDIVIYRKDWEKMGWLKYSQILNNFLQREKYRIISFPVSDYPVNNIPDLSFTYPHLFQTKYAKNEDERLSIFVREDLN